MSGQIQLQLGSYIHAQIKHILQHIYKIYIPNLNGVYRTAQNFDRGNTDEFDEFPAIRQYFLYQNFPFS